MQLTDNIQEAIVCMRLGGAIVYPTDTVFGLGVNALDSGAVRRLYRIKNRDFNKPVPIIINNLEQAKNLARINAKTEKILNAIWPGQVTVILTKKGGGTIGLRIPDHEIAQELAKEFPITGTSANLSGEEPCTGIYQILEHFKNHAPKPDLILNLELETKGKPSTVLDLTTGKPKILRIGPVNKELLLKILKI